MVRAGMLTSMAVFALSSFTAAEAQPASRSAIASLDEAAKVLVAAVLNDAKRQDPPTKPDTSRLTSAQAQQANQEYKKRLEAYDAWRNGFEKELAVLLSTAKAHWEKRPVEELLQVVDVAESPVGWTVTFDRLAGVRVLTTLAPERKDQATSLRKGQFVDVTGTISDARFSPRVGHAATRSDWTRFVDDSLQVHVEINKVQPRDRLVIGVVMSTRIQMAGAPLALGSAQSTIDALPPDAQFLFLTAPHRPAGMVTDRLLPASQENRDKVMAQTKGLPASMGGAIHQSIAEAVRIVGGARDAQGPKVVIVLAESLSAEDQRELTKMLSRSNGRATIRFCLTDDGLRLEASLLKVMSEKNVHIRPYAR